MKYPIHKIPENAPSTIEQLGSKRKFWYADNTVLFKEGYPGSGEHWSEVVASEICKILGVPAAEYEFAEHMGKIGVKCNTVVPIGGRLVLGNELLNQFVDGDYEKGKTYKNSKYTIHSVVRLHRMIQMFRQNPEKTVSRSFLANPLSQFIGYIMLDALIANQDRHHENWGYIVLENTITLAPSFDHASSLGRTETEETRKRKLTTHDERDNIKSYSLKAKSAFYLDEEQNSRVSTISAFKEFSRYNRAAARYWISKLSDISEIQLRAIFMDIPEGLISNHAMEFAIHLILINRERLLKLSF
ncbi:HipA domain-containing protein [Humidesulfovibrio sp.]